MLSLLSSPRLRRIALLALAASCAAATPASAQLIPEYEELDGIQIIEHVDDLLPGDLRFVDERGNHIRLGSLFEDDRPRLLTMNYTSCPLLCSQHLNALVEVMQELEGTAGTDYDVITVSFDPKETFQTAALTRQKYLGVYGRPEAGSAWRFLTGRRQEIEALADALGIVYRYLPEADEYVHPAVTIVCTPEGKIARYVYGPRPEVETIRRALEGAREGKVEASSLVERILHYCFYYDASTGRYGPTAIAAMRTGGVLTIAGLLVGLLIFWRREARQRRLLEVPE